MFDGKKYWKLRKQGKRGQGEPPEPDIERHFGKNRRQSRLKYPKQYFTGEVDEDGHKTYRKFTLKKAKKGIAVPHENGYKQPEPSQDPTMTNHDRHTLRQAMRQQRSKHGRN